MFRIADWNIRAHRSVKAITRCDVCGKRTENFTLYCSTVIGPRARLWSHFLLLGRLRLFRRGADLLLRSWKRSVSFIATVWAWLRQPQGCGGALRSTREASDRGSPCLMCLEPSSSVRPAPKPKAGRRCLYSLTAPLNRNVVL